MFVSRLAAGMEHYGVGQGMVCVVWCGQDEASKAADVCDLYLWVS
jgi:hypothetical protein